MKRCNDCEHYAGVQNGNGQCHRFPPTLITGFPTIDKNAWCSEFQAKPEPVKVAEPVKPAAVPTKKTKHGSKFKGHLAIMAFALCLLASASLSYAADTYSWATPVQTATPSGYETVLAVTLVSDGDGATFTNIKIDAAGIFQSQLVEVEVDHGTSTCALTIANGRGATVWYLAAMDATADKIYGGHAYLGIFPRKDADWYLTTGAMGNSDTVTIYLKFTVR